MHRESYITTGISSLQQFNVTRAVPSVMLVLDSESGLCSPAVRQVPEADVQGADHGGLLLHGLLGVGLRPTHERHQPLGQVAAEQQVDAGVGTAVQTGQQHQDGEHSSWNSGGETVVSVGSMQAIRCLEPRCFFCFLFIIELLRQQIYKI